MIGLSGPASTTELAQAVALAVAFAATMPMPSGGGALRFARAGLVIVLVPVLLGGAPHAPILAIDSALRGAAIGSALGLASTIAFSAASAAGGIANAALQWSPFPDRAVDAGAVGFLFQLGFAAVLFGSGGFSFLILTLARASGAMPVALFTPSGIAWLADIAMRDALQLAAPALFAQALATAIVGLCSRATPHIGGLLMTSPVVSTAVGLVLIAGSGSLFHRFAQIVSVWLAHLTLH